jgi:hypothetical protein
VTPPAGGQAHGLENPAFLRLPSREAIPLESEAGDLETEARGLPRFLGCLPREASLPPRLLGCLPRH